MPFNFTGQKTQDCAKLGVVSDGELIVVGTDGYSVTSTLSSYTAYLSNPVRSAVGVWSVTLKDSAYKIIDVQVATLLAAGSYLSTQLRPVTLDSQGRPVLHWGFNVAGTLTELPSGGSFIVYVVYSETSVS